METSVGRSAPLGLMLAVFAVPGVSAQERCKISWDTSASEAKYTQQLALDVGDVPGHQIRVFELHRTYLNDKQNCEGLKRAELWDHTFTDYVNRNGPWRGYAVVTMNNGDKIFQEFSGTTQTVVGPDGSKQSAFEGVTRWTGGTGKYVGVRGLERNHGTANLDKGLNEEAGDAEYWFEK
jgi:hypothetical protein